MFFKGYIQTKDKKAIEKFKNVTEFKTYEEVKSLPEFAGVLHDDAILVDIDDMKESDILFEMIKAEGIKCRVYKTTRGKHFLFKNNGVKTNKTNANTAVGIHADIKLGTRNSYEVIKYKRRSRKILQECDEQDADPIPKWLFPIKTKIDFINMEEGDGRNQALYNYILTLQSNDFSVEEGRKTIRLINSHLFDNPLSESELETILRDDAFKKPIFFKGTTFLFEKFAIFLKNHHHIKRINGQLHLYKDGVYVSGIREIEAMTITHIPSLNRSKRSEVLAYLDLLVNDNTEPSSANLVAFRNGIYDLKNDKLIDFTPDIVITNKINWDYNPAAYDELTDKTLNKITCNDKQLRSILEEIIGSCLYRSNNLAGGKAFILTGSGANGKSTYITMLKHLLGDKNISALDMKSLSDRFSTVMIYQKLANLGDDISDELNSDVSMFKKIVTGNRIEAEQKGQPKFDFEPYCKLVFSANVIPRIKDRTGSAQRRMVLIPFNAVIKNTDDDYDPFIIDKLKSQTSMEYFINLGVAGLQRVLKTNGYTKSEKVEKELNYYRKTVNPILAFIEDVKNNDEIKFENESLNDIYRLYTIFCAENEYRPYSKNEFSKQVQRELNLKTKRVRINKKQQSIFVKVEEVESG